MRLGGRAAGNRGTLSGVQRRYIGVALAGAQGERAAAYARVRASLSARNLTAARSGALTNSCVKVVCSSSLPTPLLSLSLPLPVVVHPLLSILLLSLSCSPFSSPNIYVELFYRFSGTLRVFFLRLLFFVVSFYLDALEFTSLRTRIGNQHYSGKKRTRSHYS